jgi:hypothetical protein
VADDDVAPVEDRSSRSFARFVHEDLSAERVIDGYEVQGGDEVVGWLEDPRTTPAARCVARDGDWLFRRLRGGSTEATMGTAVVARYESRLVAGGTVVMSDESRFRLRTPALGDTWRLRRARRELVLTVRPLREGWAIHLSAGTNQQLSLLTLFTFHAVLSELDRPMTGGPDSPCVGF